MSWRIEPEIVDILRRGADGAGLEHGQAVALLSLPLGSPGG
nr:hypothetical protein [uncultured Fretibacterium sp.]